MTYEGSVKFIYTCKQTHPNYNSSFPELVPDETVTIESPCYDLNVNQYFELFHKFVRAVGFSETNITDAACGIAFNDFQTEDELRRIASEYDLVLVEDHRKEIESLEAQILDLKAKLSRLENPDNPQYTDEELDAMNSNNKTYDQMIASGHEMTADGFWVPKENFKMWNGLVPGSPEAVKEGCMCPILDNQEMPADKKWVDAECPIHGRKK